MNIHEAGGSASIDAAAALSNAIFTAAASLQLHHCPLLLPWIALELLPKTPSDHHRCLMSNTVLIIHHHCHSRHPLPLSAISTPCHNCQTPSLLPLPHHYLTVVHRSYHQHYHRKTAIVMITKQGSLEGKLHRVVIVFHCCCGGMCRSCLICLLIVKCLMMTLHYHLHHPHHSHHHPHLHAHPTYIPSTLPPC